MTRANMPSAYLVATCALLFAVLGSVAGCGAPLASGGGESSGSRDVITREEILEQPVGDAYTIVRQLRAGWLRPRTIATFGSARDAAATGGSPQVYPEVFQDNTWFGPIESLRAFETNVIERMEFISALDATTLYGTGYMGGVIRVVLRR